MRHLVYLLLIANVVYLGWNLLQDRSGGQLVRELPPLPAKVRPLVTLQELEQQQELQQRGQQEEAVQGKQIAEQDMDDVAAVETLTDREPPGAGGGLLCQALGPFLATEQLDEVEERLAGQGLKTRRRSSEAQVENGWWVYLPAMPRAEAMKVVELLDDNNDREYFVGKDNFISLGTFRVLPRAERRMTQAHKIGLEPLLETLYSTETAYWLDMRLTSAPDGALAWIAEEYPDLKLEPLACR